MVKHIASWLLAGVLAFGTSLPAVAAERFVEGDAYLTLPQAQRYASDGEVELVEVFSYACIHCARFAPLMAELAAKLPDTVAVHYVPASFSPAWEPFARGYYAARELGLADRTHLELFEDKFGKNYPINSLADLADFYARHGADRDAFLQAANAPATSAQLASDLELLRAWGIEGTPTIVVDGKYVSHDVGSYQELADLAQFLVDRELARHNE